MFAQQPSRDDQRRLPSGHAFDDDLDDLRRTYPTWWQQRAGRAAVYAISLPALDCGALRPFFGHDDWNAEREYARRCHRMHAIGHRGRNPIAYPLLTRVPMPTAASHPFFVDLSRPQQLALQEAERTSADLNGRLLGVVGRLVTEMQFVREADVLWAKWERLPEAERPDPPWRRSILIPASAPLPERAPPRVAGFAAAVDNFLNRWDLDAVVDRHLPNPRGPQLTAGPPPSPAGPAPGVHLVLPLHYPLRGGDRLLEVIERLQREAAADRGLPPGVAAVARAEQYAQIARLVHLEAAVRSRFPDRVPRGLVNGILGAAAAELILSEHTVKRLRKWAKAGGPSD